MPLTITRPLVLYKVVPAEGYTTLDAYLDITSILFACDILLTALARETFCADETTLAPSNPPLFFCLSTLPFKRESLTTPASDEDCIRTSTEFVTIPSLGVWVLEGVVVVGVVAEGLLVLVTPSG